MTEPENAGLFYTEPSLANRMVEWADPQGDVLEPSAGDGSIYSAIMRHASLPDSKIRSITAVEILPENVQRLRRIHIVPTIPCTVLQEDFLEFSRERAVRYAYDIAIGNPPYEKNSDAWHTSAMLDLTPRVVVLVRTNFEHGSSTRKARPGRNELVFSKSFVKRKVVLVKRPAFYGPGNVGESARSDYVILDLSRGQPKKSHMVQTERWVL